MRVKVSLMAFIIALLFCCSCSNNQSGKAKDESIGKQKIAGKDTAKFKSDSNKNETQAFKFVIARSGIDGYWVRLPYQYNKQKQWPVIVYFHGSGYIESDLDSISNIGPTFYANRDTSQVGELRNQLFSNFIIITPHLKGTGEEPSSFWPSWAKEFTTIDAIIDTVVNKYSGNKEKIYLTGVSLGGAACWLLPNNLESPIAAVVPVCGTPQAHYGSNDPRPKEKTWNEPFEIFNANQFRKLPVWNTGNARDGWPNRIFQQIAVENIEATGGSKFLKMTTVTPIDTTYLNHKRIFTSFDKSGHNAWTETYSSSHIYKWMLTFKNSNGEINPEK